MFNKIYEFLFGKKEEDQSELAPYKIEKIEEYKVIQNDAPKIDSDKNKPEEPKVTIFDPKANEHWPFPFKRPDTELTHKKANKDV
jgi:hypothetical protein